MFFTLLLDVSLVKARNVTDGGIPSDSVGSVNCFRKKIKLVVVLVLNWFIIFPTGAKKNKSLK